MIKNCIVCGKEFYTSHKTSIYCSRQCLSSDYKKRMLGKSNPNYRDAGRKNCKVCGNEFRAYGEQKYCSHECYCRDEEILSARRENFKKKRELNTNQKRVYGVCKKCGEDIFIYRRVLCDKCKPSFGKAVCGNCGRKTRNRVLFCKECRKTGVHKKDRRSTCSVCGLIFDVPYRKYCDSCFQDFMMSHRETPRRKDANHDEIVNALIEYGCDILDASRIGGGFPDLIVKYKKRLYLMEIKNPKTNGKLNKLQQKFFDEWKEANPSVVRTPEEAIAVLERL